MDYEALLESLCERRIDAVVIDGVAAVLQGVPTTTFDLDLVPSRDERNLSRLHGLLAELEAVYREGRAVRVLDLRELVAVKQRLGREKDRAVLPVYLHTLRERDG